VQAYLKPANTLAPQDIRLGPLAEYTLAHAALYRRRAVIFSDWLQPLRGRVKAVQGAKIRKNSHFSVKWT
jgi:hypothetical protein